MNVNDLFPSRFLKAHDLGGKPFTLTIRAATLEKVGHGAEQGRKLTLAFEKATKQMLLNRTNAMIIASLYGPETDAWIGKSVIVYSARVKAFGAWHDALRIREQIPARNVGAERMTDAMQEPPPLDDEEDLLDVDEGHDGHDGPGDDNGGGYSDNDQYSIDPATGGIMGSSDLDELWNDDAPAPASDKAKAASQTQLNRIHALGMKLHPGKGEWDKERPRYVEWVTRGAITSSKELQPGEADVLIAAMERKLKTQQAAEMQSTGQPAMAAA